MSPPEPVYLDHHATTPCHPDVVAAMLPFFTQVFGNPASIHHLHGRRAATALEEARSSVASYFEARPSEVYFTAGATESNNIVLLNATMSSGDAVVSTAIEHKSVLVPLAKLQERGVDVRILTPDAEGFVSVDEVAAAITPATRLVSVMAANGEIGTIEPIAGIGALCRERGVRFHSDATQLVGKVEADFTDVDFISLSAHKLYGPKGVGALIARRGTRPAALTFGGGQEKGVRSGTVNVAGAVGLAKALEIRRKEMATEAGRLVEIREHLSRRLVAEIVNTTVHGPRELRLPGNLNVSFRDVEAETLLMSLRHFSISSGSACSSGDREPSHVLTAIGVSEEDAMHSIRIGMGRTTTTQEVDRLVDELKDRVFRIREITPAR